MPPTLTSRGRLAVTALGALAIVLVATVIVMLSRDGAAKKATPASGPEEATPSAPATEEPPSGTSARSASPIRALRAEQPNIVMVLADDMRSDDLRWMPSVRRLLADQGLTFENSFSPDPLCAPARASLLSGEYAHNHRVFSHADPYGFRAFDDRRTIGTSLQAAGYRTAFIGKYLNGYGDQPVAATGESSFRYVPPGWDDWDAAVDRPAGSGYSSGGTYNYLHTIFNHNGTIDDTHDGQYQTDVIGRMTRRVIRTYHHSTKPFFLYVAPVAPHFGMPHEADDPRGLTKPGTGRPERIKTPARPRWVRGRFDDRILRASGLPSDGGPAEADVRDKPRPIRDTPELSRAERVAVRSSTRQRAEALYVLDGQVGKILHTLRTTHELAHTVFVFTSDNGYFLGEHRVRQGKIKPHEPSLRVPFLVAGPGIPHGRRDDPVTTPDLSATILDVAHATPPHALDGYSVVPSFARDRGWEVPVVTEGTETSRVFRDAELDPAPGFDDARTTIGIRTPRWKYVRYVDGDGELYDLDRDPNELHSRFGDPAYRGVQAELSRLWERDKDCKGRTCRVRMPADLRRGPAQDRVGTTRQARGVLARYGYEW